MVVHRETRELTENPACIPTLAKAKAGWKGPDSDQAILSLTREGGGLELWMADEQKERLMARVNKWRGCYGAWPIRRIATKGAT